VGLAWGVVPGRAHAGMTLDSASARPHETTQEIVCVLATGRAACDYPTMSDEFDRISRGGATAVVGLATMDPLKIGEGLATVFGFETNASVVQKATALAHENFVFEVLMKLEGASARHKGRLDTFEQRLAKLTWIIEEFEARLGEHGAVSSDLAALLEASFKVWKATADAKKRKLLGNALLNVFDPRMYEEGLSLRLLDILSGLTYGDVHTLSLADENERYSRDIKSKPPIDGKMRSS
jgi:hypothetical protein